MLPRQQYLRAKMRVELNRIGRQFMVERPSKPPVNHVCYVLLHATGNTLAKNQVEVEVEVGCHDSGCCVYRAWAVLRHRWRN